MTDYITPVAQLITALVALAAFLQSSRNGRKIEEVHKATNSMKDELVKTTATANFAAGAKQGEDNPR